MLMFIDITDGSCKGSLFTFINRMTCGMMNVGSWYKSRREALQRQGIESPGAGRDMKMPAKDEEHVPPAVQNTIHRPEE